MTTPEDNDPLFNLPADANEWNYADHELNKANAAFFEQAMEELAKQSQEIGGYES